MDKARILVVEDESLLAEHIQERLKNLGYDVAALDLTLAAAYSSAVALVRPWGSICPRAQRMVVSL